MLFDGLRERCGSVFYMIARVLVGLMFFLHGAQKFGIWGDGNITGLAGALGLPVAVAGALATVELAGGVAILAGAFTRLAALGGGVIVLVAYFMAHFPKGWNPLTNGGELALMYLAAFLVLIVYGGGKYGLENIILKKEIF